MVEDRIGHRYAKSAFDLAEEKNIVDDARSDMALILDIYNQNKDFADFLKSPLISSLKKEAVTNALFEGKLKTDLVDLLVKLVVRKGREMYLPNVAEAFLSIYDEEKGILRGVFTSATPLPDGVAKEVKSLMEQKTGKTFEMEQGVDPELIGGFTLKIGDTLFDGSIATSIRKMKREFIKNN